MVNEGKTYDCLLSSNENEWQFLVIGSMSLSYQKTFGLGQHCSEPACELGWIETKKLFHASNGTIVNKFPSLTRSIHLFGTFGVAFPNTIFNAGESKGMGNRN